MLRANVAAAELLAVPDVPPGTPLARISPLGALVRQARLLDQATGDLLAAAQAQRGRLLVEARPVPLAPLLAGVAADACGDVAVDCPAGLVASADPSELVEAATGRAPLRVLLVDDVADLRLLLASTSCARPDHRAARPGRRDHRCVTQEAPTRRPADPADDAQAEEKDEALDRIVLRGAPRLHRAWYDLLATATVAGLEIGIGVLALLVVERETGSVLLGSIAFSLGFVALLLGHSELFTEGFLVPVTTVVAGAATWRQLGRLWVGTLIGNVVGGWIVAWLIVTGLPSLRELAIRRGTEYAASSLTPRTFALAVLAGAAITLMTRMQNGTDDDMARIVACVAVAFVIVGGGLYHSILDSILVFTALHAGAPGIGYGNWAWWFTWTVVGNLVGGLGLVTLLRLIRSQDRLGEWRRQIRE